MIEESFGILFAPFDRVLEFVETQNDTLSRLLQDCNQAIGERIVGFDRFGVRRQVFQRRPEETSNRVNS
jgi:hypothetical protein